MACRAAFELLSVIMNLFMEAASCFICLVALWRSSHFSSTRRHAYHASYDCAIRIGGWQRMFSHSSMLKSQYAL